MTTVSESATGALHDQGCLFCRRTDRGFVAEEHIFSYALGNRGEFVLPPGVVCDPCNNGRLAPAEHAFSSFEPIEMLLAERGIGTRKKKGIVSRWNGTQIWWSAPGEMNVASSRDEVMKWDDATSGKLELKGRKVLRTQFFEQVARVVWKTALEFVYHDHGPDVAFDPKFDPVRQMVAGQSEARGWVVVPSDGRAHQNVRLEYELSRVLDGEERTPVLLDVFGVRFYSDLIAHDFDFAVQRNMPAWPANIWTFPDAMPSS